MWFDLAFYKYHAPNGAINEDPAFLTSSYLLSAANARDKLPLPEGNGNMTSIVPAAALYVSYVLLGYENHVPGPAAEPEWNYLGVEIREPLVDEANRLAAEAGLKNLHYTFCNAMLWLDRLLERIPSGILRKVTIQFPDPWFKKKHAKRRMVNVEMVETISRRLTPGAKVFVQTDIEPLADEIAEVFGANGGFHSSPAAENPMPVKTEREKAVEAKELPVYRAIFTKV